MIQRTGKETRDRGRIPGQSADRNKPPLVDGPSDPKLQTLLDTIRNPSHHFMNDGDTVTNAAVRMLGKNPHHTKQVAALLSDPDLNTRRNAAYVLRWHAYNNGRGMLRVRDAVQAALKDEDHLVRNDAVQTFRNMFHNQKGSQLAMRYVRAIADMLCDDDSWVRKNAAQAIWLAAGLTNDRTREELTEIIDKVTASDEFKEKNAGDPHEAEVLTCLNHARVTCGISFAPAGKQ